MEYELTKQLKDAGFEQEYFGGHYLGRDGKYASPQISHSVFPGIDDATYAPTLEELIEACGEALSELVRYGDKWVARCEVKGNWGRHEFLGTTPTEAVAKLWLALNKKP